APKLPSKPIFPCYIKHPAPKLPSKPTFPCYSKHPAPKLPCKPTFPCYSKHPAPKLPSKPTFSCYDGNSLASYSQLSVFPVSSTQVVLNLFTQRCSYMFRQQRM